MSVNSATMTTDKRLHILLTNDDGFDAPGLRLMYDALRERYDITVAAPLRQQSGIGHAFTFEAPLHYEKVETPGRLPGYVIDGTPSDCVKFAVSHLLPAKPDLVVSGINNGENSGICGFYSGTVGAAREGAFWRILSVAYSVDRNAIEHSTEYCRIAAQITDRLVDLHRRGVTNPLRHVFFNVNFPACPPEQSRGIRVTRQSLAFFDDRYKQILTSQGREGYMIYGDKTELESSNEFDSPALIDKYITVTPLDFDATAEDLLAELARSESSFSRISEQRSHSHG